MINDHKTAMKVHLPYKITDSETKFGEWKIQLKMWINCISSTNFEDTRTIHSVSNNIEILTVVKQMILLMNLLNLFYKNIKTQEKNRLTKEEN